MALRYLDSFDSYSTTQLTQGRWTTLAQSGTTVLVSAGNGRRSTGCLRVDGNPTGAVSGRVTKTLDAQATWIAGFAFRRDVFNAAADICSLYDGATPQLDLVLTTTGTLAVTRNGSVLGTSTAVMSSNTYAYLELKATIHQTTGAVTVRMNGAEILALTNVDTQNSANATADVFLLGNVRVPLGNNANLDYDDLYLCDGTGSAPHNTFLGECRVDALLPSSDGTHQAWTPSTPGTHYTLVDEPAPNTTDYVSSFTPTQRETYGMQDLTAPSGTIYGVQLGLAALKSDAGARSLKPLLLSGGAEALGEAQALSTSQTSTLYVQTTDPATGVAWTEAGVNGAQCGAEVGSG